MQVAVLVGYPSLYHPVPVAIAYALDLEHLPYGQFSMNGLAETSLWAQVDADSPEHRAAVRASSSWTLE